MRRFVQVAQRQKREHDQRDNAGARQPISGFIHPQTVADRTGPRQNAARILPIALRCAAWTFCRVLPQRLPTSSKVSGSSVPMP